MDYLYDKIKSYNYLLHIIATRDRQASVEELPQRMKTHLNVTNVRRNENIKVLDKIEKDCLSLSRRSV